MENNEIQEAFAKAKAQVDLAFAQLEIDLIRASIARIDRMIEECQALTEATREPLG